MKLLRADEMKEIDRRASSDFAIPSIVLMENAGIRTVEIADDLLGDPQEKSVVVIAGKGNNGGDGLVIARHLINSGASVTTFLMSDADALTPDSYTNYQILSKMTEDIYPLCKEEDLDKLMTTVLTADLLIDAMYGIGLKGSLNEFDSAIVKIINWSNVPVIAVDIPSGVEADTGKVHGEAVIASHTVTFALPKIGLILEPGKNCAGTLSVADISIPAQLLQDSNLQNNLIDESMVKSMIKPRLPESHKGTYGHVLVLGGSQGLTGAVIMASHAALRSGAGTVTAALPESLVPAVTAGLVEVMTAPLPETRQAAIAIEALPAIGNLLGTASVCTVGPGMSRYPEANAILRFVLESSGIPVVIDADGLNALEGDIAVLKDRQIPVVLTPHPGEMARLTGTTIDEVQSNRIEFAREYARQWGVTLVLKGNKTVIANSSGDTYVNITGNPGMATAGSGDVLCGIISGLIAQGLKPQDAAIAGVYLHGLAGDQAAELIGARGLVAGDLINNLPGVMARLEITC
ncbi:MAG: NAD(P)H-hydrate dehydratase [Syntrophomonadaceae bacterium]|nr:NAD(P)H-hydrate dehydratase [Syntrophomonadaceae bacterium]